MHLQYRNATAGAVSGQNWDFTEKYTWKEEEVQRSTPDKNGPGCWAVEGPVPAPAGNEDMEAVQLWTGEEVNTAHSGEGLMVWPF